MTISRSTSGRSKFDNRFANERGENLPELVTQNRTHGLVDILDRVLDKGLVIAGDIKINLANVELLTIQVRLLICSIDKDEQIGLNWWRNDTRLTMAPAGATTSDVEARLARIEDQLTR